MKYILAALLVLPIFCWGQDAASAMASGGIAARWAKARDYLSCKLALEAIRGKVRTDTSIRGRFARIEPVLAAVTPDAPPSAAVLDGELKDFARVRLVVVEPIGRVDVRGFASSPDGVRRLVDTAFLLAGKGYVFNEGVKAAVRAEVGKFLAAVPRDSTPRVASSAAAQPSKPVIALGGQPDGTSSAAVRGGRGFDFWVLLPILLVGVVCVILWRKYQEIKEELRARKVEMRSFNENYFASAAGSGSASRGSAKGADRKEVERLIADSNVIAELNQAIGRLQLRISQLEGKGAAPAAAGGSAAPAPGGSGGPGFAKGKGKAVEPEKARPGNGDGADVFYMAGPVNNYFPNSAKSFTKDNTVYRFKVSANKQDAEFELHTSGAPINEIVQLAESYIKAACDEENLPSYPVKNIVTKKAGQAILDGDKWIIKSKALIRYE